VHVAHTDSLRLYLGYPGSILVQPGGEYPVNLVAAQDGEFLPDGTVVHFASTLGTMQPFEAVLTNGSAQSVITDLPVGVQGEFVVVAIVEGQQVYSDPPIQMVLE